MSEASDAISKAIDDASGPDKMSKKEALEFLEEIASDLEGKIDALRGEIQNEEGE